MNNEDELKRIHGDDVELAPDDSEDEHLPEGTVEDGHPPIRYAVVPIGTFDPGAAVEVDGEKYDFADLDVAEKAMSHLKDDEGNNVSDQHTIIEWRGQTPKPDTTTVSA